MGPIRLDRGEDLGYPLSVLPKLRFFFRQALAALLRSFGVTALAVGTIGVALAVLATFVIIVANLDRVADQLGRDVEISAYLKRGLTLAEGEALAAQAKAWAEVEVARYLPSELAMEEFKASLGEDGVLLEGLPPDVLPASLEITLHPHPWTGTEVQAIGARLKGLSGVEDVRYGQEELDRVNALLSFARVGTLVLGFALCLATILIVSNTIRLTVYARRDEIDIMSLVGATNAFVRAPFVLEGAIQGLLGGGLAVASLVVLENGLRVGLERGLSYAYGPIELSVVPLELYIYLLILGLVLGLVGSLLAVGKFLRV